MNDPTSTNPHYLAGYADGRSDALIGQALTVLTNSPYWDGYADGATHARLDR